MATVKIELELDWLNPEESIDDQIKEQVISNLQEKLISNIEGKVTAELNAQLEEIAGRVSTSFIEKTLETKIEDLQIPIKRGGYWDSKVEYIPISQFIGMKYEKHLTEKVFDEHGRKPDRKNDAKLSISEYFIKNYLEKELTTKISGMIQTARKDAEETIVKALENNLKEQLSVDIIQRLNIPKMLESLQNKALEFQEESK